MMFPSCLVLLFERGCCFVVEVEQAQVLAIVVGVIALGFLVLL